MKTTTVKDLPNDRRRRLTAARSAILLLLLAAAGTVKAGVNGADRQPPLTDSIGSSLPFLIDTLCVVSDPERSLQPFVAGLQQLRAGRDTVINIVHLGDSHIQAGFLSGRTMRMLQASFGNAGRGWIAPLKLSRANEPGDYFISSSIRDWKAGRCIEATPGCPWGIGGIGIQTSAPAVDFNLVIAPRNGSGYSFNKVLLYRDRNALPMAPLSRTSPSLRASDSVSVVSRGCPLYENIVVDTFTTPTLLDTFRLAGAGADTPKSNSLYYGFMLMNGRPGILYHSIGVNGARFTDYTSRSYVRQLGLLRPSLLIVSLGTNEAFGRSFSREQFLSQVDAFVRLVREELPETVLLMTTPAESYRRAYKNKKRYYVRNDNIARVADALSAYAGENGIACWDLFAITGGDNSCGKWFEAGMFGRDRIHFSREGYGEQGVLLYKALVRSCLAYEAADAPAEDFIIAGMDAVEDPVAAGESEDVTAANVEVVTETEAFAEDVPAHDELAEAALSAGDPGEEAECVTIPETGARGISRIFRFLSFKRAR